MLANPEFGALVSEAGTGCTWAGNSRRHQCTPWGTDALADNLGASFWVQDLCSNTVWSLGGGAPCHATHGRGSTESRLQRSDIGLCTSWTVDDGRALKRVRVALHNQDARSARLRVVGLLIWMPGSVRVDRQSVDTAFAALPAADGALPLDLLLATQRDELAANLHLDHRRLLPPARRRAVLNPVRRHSSGGARGRSKRPASLRHQASQEPPSRVGPSSARTSINKR